MPKVCWKCFADDDLVTFVRTNGKRGHCDYCGTSRILCCEFGCISEFIRERLAEYYSRAVDELPYDSGEGGYLGTTYDSYDLIDDHAVVADCDKLRHELASELGDDIWCEYNWTSLELDSAYNLAWKRFCDTIKHERRFFFATFGHDPDDRDSISPIGILDTLAHWIDELGLMTTLPAGGHVWRARASGPGVTYKTPAELGPPPAESALQANRMNPAGIPMFYAAAKEKTAAVETPGKHLSLGKFRLLRRLQMVDLAGLPPVPGFFGDASKRERLTIRFLHDFRKSIEQPIARDEKTHIDYLPSQVVTEYFRTCKIGGGAVDGVIYRSAKLPNEIDYVFFAQQSHIQNAVKRQWFQQDDPEWFSLVKTKSLTRQK